MSDWVRQFLEAKDNNAEREEVENLASRHGAPGEDGGASGMGRSLDVLVSWTTDWSL